MRYLSGSNAHACAEETFAGGVIAAVTDRAHGADQGVLLQEPLVITVSELTAPVRVQYDRALVLALPHSHFDRAEYHWQTAEKHYVTFGDECTVEG